MSPQSKSTASQHGAATLAAVARRILWGRSPSRPPRSSRDYVVPPGRPRCSSSSGARAVPLAWLIGEATEHAAEHTGPGIGGFLNASFGNAPELIIALFAINRRADRASSAARSPARSSRTSCSCSALSLIAGGRRRPRPRARASLSARAVARRGGRSSSIPSIPGWHGDPERHSLVVLSIPVSIVLLVALRGGHRRNLRRHRAAARDADELEGVWPLPTLARRARRCHGRDRARSRRSSSHSLDDVRARGRALRDFFVAIVIVAIVGNAAEHGGAIVVAHRGNISSRPRSRSRRRRRSPSSSIPAVALLSWIDRARPALSFRPVELADDGGRSLRVVVAV